MRTRRTTVGILSTILLVVFAVMGGVVATAALSPSGASATTLSCVANQPTRVGLVGGIVPALSSRRGPVSNCRVSTTSPVSANYPSNTTPPYYIADGNPPLINNGGPVMNGTSAVVVTPIYWAPSGHSFPSTYQSLTTRFITDIAAASGSSTNVFSILTQYESGSQTSYDITSATPIVDTNSYPAVNCTADTGSIYPDNTGYSACLTNPQILTELTSELSALHLTGDVHHLYMIFLPEGVETCFTSVNGTSGGQCSLNATTAGFCGYHTATTVGGTVLAVLPYAITGGATNYACSSQYAQYADTSYVGIQSPNYNLAADTEISVMSHEMSESITDPYLNAWLDSVNYEVGDECAYIYGDSFSLQGGNGAEYNQTINGHQYFIQEEFSNNAYNVDNNYGCAQNDQASVVFDPNGGSGSMPPLFGLSSAALTPNGFTNAGLDFGGWNTAPDGSGQSYANGATFPFSDSATLYAQWGHTVTFNANGGSGTMAPETRDVATTLTANGFTRSGYTFKGWNTSADGSGSSYPDSFNYPFTFNFNFTLYAQWAIISTVTFNGNGGSGYMASESGSFPALLTPSAFTRPGYAFTGWSTAANGIGFYYQNGASYYFGSSVTLYAQWAIVLPSAPLNLTAHVGANSVTLTWAASTSGGPLDGYFVREGTARGTEVMAPINFGIPITGLSFVVTGVMPGETHSFYVTSENAQGSSPPSNEVVVTMPRSPSTTALMIAPVLVSHLKTQHVVFHVKVVAAGTTTAAHATVRILSGSKLLCHFALSATGTGSCRIGSAKLHIGRHSVVAQFSGDKNVRGSKSAVRVFKVT